MDCDEKTGWSHITKRLITVAVFEDDAIVYVMTGETNVAVELASR